MSRPDPEGDVFGLVRLSGAVVALPLSALREVVPLPAVLDPLPVPAPGLLGALRLRSLVLPVVDVRPRLGLEAARAEHPVVIVVGGRDQLVGIVADEVLGITAVAAADLLELRTPEPHLVRSTFCDPALDAAVCVLDPDRLLALPDVPSLRTLPVAADPADGRRSGACELRRLTLLRCGAYVLGLDSRHVHTLLPPVTLQPSVLVGGACPGVTTYADREVAVVDPLVLLGLGELPAGGPGAGVVLDLEGGYVVLGVTQLLDLVEVAAEQVLALPPFAVRQGALLSGLLDIPAHGQCLVLDGDAVSSHRELVTLAGLNTLLGDEPDAGQDVGPVAGTTSAAAGPSRRTYLAYSAGSDVVTPLEQVVEILPVPATSTATGAHPAVLGVVVHRRAAVPLLCLATLLGGPPVRDPACALLVHVDGDPVAFVVEALRAIEPLAWEDVAPPPAVAPVRTPVELLRASPLVQVGAGAGLVRDLDLQAVARMVRNGSALAPDEDEPVDELAAVGQPLR